MFEYVDLRKEKEQILKRLRQINKRLDELDEATKKLNESNKYSGFIVAPKIVKKETW